MPLKVLFASLLMLLSGGCMALTDWASPGSGSAPGTVTLYGTVVDSKSRNPILNADVQVDGLDVSFSDGHFSLSGLAHGPLQLRVSGPFHREKVVDVDIVGQDVWMYISLDTVFSDEELWDLAAIVRAEAEGEPYVGQVAVAASVLNRWESPVYPNNLTDVIYQVVGGYYQYSPVLDGRINLGPNTASWQAVGEAIAGADPSDAATGFFAHGKVRPPSWVLQQPVTTVIANHTFFRPPYEALGLLPR